MRRLPQLLCVFVLLMVLGCGGGGGVGSTAPKRITITPDPLLVGVGDSMQVQAVLTGIGGSVTWSASAGVITPTGPTTAVYTAPNQAGTYQITATSDQNSALTVTATVEVLNPGVTIRPLSAETITCGTVELNAYVLGESNQQVSWSVSAGSITPTGEGSATFHAPGTAQMVTVTATSVANPSLSDSIQIDVQERPAVIRGKVMSMNGVGVGGVRVQMMDDTGAVLATGTTESDGTFGVVSPMSVVRFQVDPQSIPSAYYTRYRYGGRVYEAADVNCPAPLPEVCGHLEVNLPSAIVLVPRTLPAPDPTGCS
jgi:hypothetical protein